MVDVRVDEFSQIALKDMLGINFINVVLIIESHAVNRFYRGVGHSTSQSVVESE